MGRLVAADLYDRAAPIYGQVGPDIFVALGERLVVLLDLSYLIRPQEIAAELAA